MSIAPPGRKVASLSSPTVSSPPKAYLALQDFAVAQQQNPYQSALLLDGQQRLTVNLRRAVSIFIISLSRQLAERSPMI
jgi:hypothetical protein